MSDVRIYYFILRMKDSGYKSKHYFLFFFFILVPSFYISGCEFSQFVYSSFKNDGSFDKQ